LRAQDDAKIVVEVAGATEGIIDGKLLEKQDETHYVRTANAADIAWGQDTAVVHGKGRRHSPGRDRARHRETGCRPQRARQADRDPDRIGEDEVRCMLRPFGSESMTPADFS
jgi:hypothetical protein